MTAMNLPVGAIEQEPGVTLWAWSAYKVQLPGSKGAASYHLVGWRVETTRGRASSPVELVDPIRRRCMTQTGTVYELQGSPGMTTDALAAWGRYRRVNRVVEEEDVTEYLDALLGGAGGAA